MNTHLYTIMLICISSLFYSQDLIRVQYLMENNNPQEEHIFNVDISPEKSIFYVNNLCSDDLPATYIMIQKKGSEVTILDKINGIDISIDHNKNLDWTILNETKIENNIKMQKAIAKYNNELYTAWFSQDLGINEAPFIFKGLPGLVVSLESKLGNIKFSLISVSATNNILCEKTNIAKSKHLNINTYKTITENSNDLNSALLQSFDRLNFPQEGMKVLYKREKEKKDIDFLFRSLF